MELLLTKSNKNVTKFIGDYLRILGIDQYLSNKEKIECCLE